MQSLNPKQHHNLVIKSTCHIVKVGPYFSFSSLTTAWIKFRWLSRAERSVLLSLFEQLMNPEYSYFPPQDSNLSSSKRNKKNYLKGFSLTKGSKMKKQHKQKPWERTAGKQNTRYINMKYASWLVPSPNPSIMIPRTHPIIP